MPAQTIQQTKNLLSNKINQPTQIASSPHKSAPLVVCQHCQGTKFVRFGVEIGDPRFGRVFPCQACNNDALIMASGMNPLETKITLDALATQGRPGTLRMVSAARRFLKTKTGMLSIYGGYGNGKSTTLKAIVNECLKAGIEAKYMTMYEVMAYAKDAFDSRQAGDTDAGRITRIANTPILCLDELDKARMTEYAQEIQTHLFDVRYRRADVLGTVIAWNGTLETLGMPWVVSRISEFETVNNTDSDLRPIIGGAK